MVRICDSLGMLPEEQVRIIDFYNRWHLFSPVTNARLVHILKKIVLCSSWRPEDETQGM